MVVSFDFRLPAYRRGFHLVSNIIFEKIKDSLPKDGILSLTLKHTSAGLTLNENADPSVRDDFESFINHLVPENMSIYTHVFEGSDDMPAHLKSSIIGVTVTVPIKDFQFNLGTWQGIYLCEFRDQGGSRSISATIIS